MTSEERAALEALEDDELDAVLDWFANPVDGEPFPGARDFDGDWNQHHLTEGRDQFGNEEW